MNITTKGRYALRIMIDLAQQEEDTAVSLKTISQRQGISMKYLEAIAAVLQKADYIRSSRGKNGGYRLSRKPEEYCIVFPPYRSSFSISTKVSANFSPVPRTKLPLWLS